MASTKNQGQGDNQGTNASLNVHVQDGAGNDVSVKVSDRAGSDDISIKVHDGAGSDDISIKVQDGSGDDVSVKVQDGAGSDDISIKVHDGAGDDISVRVHDGASSDDISVEVHNGSGDNISVHVHDGSGGDPPCYCRGTSILTERGNVRVEELAIGDKVVTASGRPKPIKWIGRRSYSGRFITSSRRVLPIVVRAGALAPEVPAHDLWLSPGHALLLDEVLVPVQLLVNASTVVHADTVDKVEYFHLEFETHEIVFAEGAPAESYVECDNRQGFHNAEEFAALYPDDARASFGYCRPRLEVGMPQLGAIRAGLFERAAALGHLTTADPELRVVSGGSEISAQSIEGRNYVFRLDAPSDEVWLASRCGVPAELELLSTDERRLGVCIERLVLRDDYQRLEISHAHPSLREGFHGDEEGLRRWTNGMARIPERFLRGFTGGFAIEVHCLPPLPRYPLPPRAEAVPQQIAKPTVSARRPMRSRARPAGGGKAKVRAGPKQPPQAAAAVA